MDAKAEKGLGAASASPAAVGAEPIVRILDASNEVDRGGYRLPIYHLGEKHYFQDSIPVEYVERDEEAQPRPYNQAAAEKIADSVRRKVLMQPILCRWSGEKRRFLVTEGQHRHRSFADFLVRDGIPGATHIPAIVYIDMEKRIALQCGIEANAEDRARSLTGQEMARKAASILETTRADIASERKVEPRDVTEREIFDYLGKRKLSEEKQYLLGDLVEMLYKDPDAKIKAYLSDRSSAVAPITVKNFQFFLTRLTHLQALDAGEDNLRDDQYANVRRLTNLFVEKVLDGKWKPDAPEPTAEHIHAKNLSRRHPFEALGYFMAKIVDRSGGSEATVGACWAKTDKIDWPRVEKDVTDLLASHVWDEPQTYTCRSIDEIKVLVNRVISV